MLDKPRTSQVSGELEDKVDGLESDLNSALDVLWRRGGKDARDWIWMNYRKFAALKGNGEGR